MKSSAKPEIDAIDTRKLTDKAGNIYKALVIIGKRANQLRIETKEELTAKLAEFAPTIDTLEEITENKEQIQISKYYESLPKSSLIALQEFIDDEVYFREPEI